MQQKLPVSTFIIAKNEEDRIHRCILSVRDWVDEVIVIDSGSTDGTVKIAHELGARVEFHEWQGYGPQKAYGETLCRNHWLLNLDADEEVSPELAKEIKYLFGTEEPTCKGYSICIMVLYRFQEKLPWFAARSWQIRLYHRQYGKFSTSTVHDSVQMQPGAQTGKLTPPVLHRCFRSYRHMMEKINFYSSMQAEDMFRRGRNPSWFKILLTPPFAFLKCYFLRRYIFYGWDGFIHSWLYALGRVLKYAKTRELFQEREFNRRHGK